MPKLRRTYIDQAIDILKDLGSLHLIVGPSLL